MSNNCQDKGIGRVWRMGYLGYILHCFILEWRLPNVGTDERDVGNTTMGIMMEWNLHVLLNRLAALLSVYVSVVCVCVCWRVEFFNFHTNCKFTAPSHTQWTDRELFSS